MAKENEVKKLGRVEYIEPNSLFVHSAGNKIQNGIPQPYEDYSFSVNLRVINGDRFGCGMTGEGNDISKDTIEFSSDNGTLSFMDGTSVGGQGYLTTNFTDINMNDPSTNTKECLGIESITVKYDSWYYPTVDIRFIDVRGASLMQPSEYEYYNTGNPKKTAYRKSNSDFFKAFFSFPYPLFKLSIKGFYGKEVTYDLSVLKCNVEFNSSTGNFEVSASFIGYMYGMYSDLPFPFVYLAPYIDLYGKNTWDEKRITGDFCYLTTDKENPIGKAMYTFPELKREVENAGQAADKEIEASSGGTKRNELKKLINKLEQEVLGSCPTSSGKGNKVSWWSWSKNENDTDSAGYFFIPLDTSVEANRKIFENFLKFSKYVQEYNEFVGSDAVKYYKGKTILSKEIFNDFVKDSKAILDKKRGASGASASTLSSEFTDDDIKKVLSGKIVSLAFHKDDKDKEKPVLVFDATKSDFGSGSNKSNQSEYDDLIKELIRRFNEDQVKSPMQKGAVQKEWTIRALKINDIYYKNKIVNIVNDLKRDLEDLTTELDRYRKLQIEHAIGFKPSMRNMYNMVFAHIDTFMSTFYNTLDRIRQKIQSDDDSRKFEKLCGGDIQCDVNENALKSDSPNGGKLPPFTMFFREETEKDGKEKKISMIWPGKLNGGEDLEEVKLVESIINATALNRKSFDPVTPEYNEAVREGDLAPINYYDVIREKGNPYLDILNDKSLTDENVVHDMLRVFVLRCYYSMLSGSYVAPEAGSSNDGRSTATANFTKKAKLVAELEVGNVERAFKMLKMKPTKAFLLGLNKLPLDPTILSMILTNTSRIGTKPLFTANAGNGDLTYTWLTKVSGDTEYFKFLPVGIFDNQTLTNLAAGANLKENADKFLKINSAGTIVNRDSCHIYSGGRKLEGTLTKYTSGDFVNASRLFPNFISTPQTVSGLNYFYDAATLDELPSVPSYRKTDAGETSIFMDPLYYAQKSREARAYLFLMGVQFDKDKKFFLPDRAENGDYPTLLLLREGAYYWRNQWIIVEEQEGVQTPTILDDPIEYKYTVNGSEIDTLGDIERNDPCFGKKVAIEFFSNPPKYVSESRKQALMDYFLKWADNISAEDNPNVPAPAATGASYVHIEVPATSMSFQEIESKLALWEMDEERELKQLLGPESCISAITVEYASTFANTTSLKECYIIGPDDRLGQSNGKIRTNVLILDAITSHAITSKGEIDPITMQVMQRAAEAMGIDPAALIDQAYAQAKKDNNDSFIEKFKKFYFGNDTILDYSCLDNPSEKFTVPRSAMNDAMVAFVGGLKEDYKISIDYLKEHTGADSAGVPEDKSSMPEYFKSDDLKLACYMALKNMYDRWLCNRRRESWYFSCVPSRMKTGEVESDFLRFFYVDEFYHEIGMRVRPNLTNTINKICDLGGFTEKTKEENLAADSIMKVLSFTAQYGGCALLALPTMLGLANTYTSENNSVADVFKAYPYNEAVRSNNIKSSFVVLYSNQKSSILDIKSDSGKMGYKTDGFDIANTWGEIVPQVMFADDDDDSFVVPCFGVTFAKQNQSYFKDVKLSMQDHQITEFSVKNEIMISYQNNKGPRETAIIGQDLYSVYSNYSYSCSVTMMGDAQITPLMYFQLNNIAMWKGAYMITNVQHNITARGMETTFTGVRQSRYAVPFRDDDMDMPASDATKQTPQSQDNPTTPTTPNEDLNISMRPLDLINVEDVSSIVLVLDRTSFRTSTKWVSGFLSAIVYYKDGTVKNYNDFAQTIEATYGLTKRIKLMGTTAGTIENFSRELYASPEDNNVLFCIPAGRYSDVFVENPLRGEEYRDTNDSFYAFTNGKHMIVSDARLGENRCEIITGETTYDKFETGGFTEISLGGTSPIMLYPPVDTDLSKAYDKNEIRAAYRELFDLIRRMNEAKKPMTFLLNEDKNIQNNIS